MEFSNAKNNFSKEPFEYPYTKPAYMKNLIDYFNPLADAGLVVVELLKYLNVPATRTTIQKELVEHPDYPSLLSFLSQQKGKIGAMHDWCEETAITFTPTFFINGYQLPSLYSVSDLKYFLMS